MMPSRTTIPLILFTLALSFAAVALIVNGALTTPTIEEISASCGEKFAALQKPMDCPSIEAPKGEKIVVNPTSTYPGFSYPAGWNAIATTKDTLLGTQTTITLAPQGLFTSCDTCIKSVFATIITEPYTLTGTETLDARVKERYSTIPNATIQKTTLGNGTKYTVSGVSLGESPAPFTDILFFGATTQVTALFSTPTDSSLGTTEQNALLASLDFSLIP